MRYCDECRDYHYIEGNHYPLFEVNVVGWPRDLAEPDWRLIRASDAESAALKAAEEYDQEDYPLSKGNSVVVEVRLPYAQEIEQFTCSAEIVPRYYAERVRG